MIAAWSCGDRRLQASARNCREFLETRSNADRKHAVTKSSPRILEGNCGLLRSDESTVRRWEKERGLPIHRLPGGGGAKIFAYTDELQEWLSERKRQDAIVSNPATVPQDTLTDETAPPAGWTIRYRVPLGLGVLMLLGALAAILYFSFSGRPGRASRPAMRSIAVLPLANLTGDSGQDYLAAGMTDELITELARISSLRVVSRTSVQQYARTSKPLPVIAQELDVDAIVEGSVGARTKRESGQCPTARRAQ